MAGEPASTGKDSGSGVPIPPFPSKELCSELVSYYPALLYELKRRVCCPHTAADLVQDAYVRAFRSIRKYGPPRDPREWLRAIARNAARDHFRGFFRHHADAPELIRTLAEECEDPELRVALFWDVTSAVLAAAIAALPPAPQALIRGYYFHGKRSDELAQELGIKRTNVKVRLFRARKKLRIELQRLDGRRP